MHPYLGGKVAVGRTAHVFERDVLEALADAERLKILRWLRDPEAHFPRQKDGDPVADGVCCSRIAEKLGVSQPTCARHLEMLNRAGLLRSSEIGQRVVYQRCESRIAEVRNQLSGDW